MNKKTKITVIVPIFKRRKMVDQAIESILSQKNIDLDLLEIILVDDEKDKDIEKKNKMYFQSKSKKIKYLVNNFDEGPGGARQTGLKVSKGEYILFLDSDDLIEENYVYQMYKKIVNTKAVAVLCMSSPFFDGEFNFNTKVKLLFLCFVRDTFLKIMSIFNRGRLTSGSFYLAQFSHLLFRSEKIKNITFNYDYRRGGEDWDFFVKALTKGDILILPRRLLKFRYSVGSSTSDKVNKAEKWKSYSLLISRLPVKFRRSLFYFLFKLYVSIFSLKS